MRMLFDSHVPSDLIGDYIDEHFPAPSNKHCSLHQSRFLRDRKLYLQEELGREVSDLESYGRYQKELSGKFWLFYLERYGCDFYCNPEIKRATILRGDDVFMERVLMPRIEKMNERGIDHQYFDLARLLAVAFPDIPNPFALAV